ncbi:hypothetical protein J4467_00210 [Candidatus Woesearchaeota archaeon]|nr:hypothetical protein [Candidatus Woesearchaeota archaeon]
MPKSISIQQKTLGIALLIALILLFIKSYNLNIIGEIIILVIAIILLLK